MIDGYYIDPELGQAHQVGLYVQAKAGLASQFRLAVQRAGFNVVKYMVSNRPEYNHFTYVSLPDNSTDRPAIAVRLRLVCEAQCTQVNAVAAPDYDAWRDSFNTYIQTYRKQRFDQPETPPSDAFDKARAYDLIASAHYEEAERYLRRFADDAPPALSPIYLVYLYHVWQRPAEVVAVHRRYESLFRASDLDHHVVAWIAEAYLAEGQPERARAMVDEFLPEFQRQGVAEELMRLRARACERTSSA